MKQITENAVVIQYKNSQFGNDKTIRQVYSDGEKFYALAYGAVNAIEINGVDYIEIEKVNDKWIQR